MQDAGCRWALGNPSTASQGGVLHTRRRMHICRYSPSPESMRCDPGSVERLDLLMPAYGPHPPCFLLQRLHHLIGSLLPCAVPAVAVSDGTSPG